MLKIDAVELMRRIRQGLEDRYTRLSLQERVERIHKEVREDPRWKRFLKRHRAHSE